MRAELLRALRCPHCGGRLVLGDARGPSASEIERGILYDDCAAYPVVAGIAYLRTGEPCERALEHLGRGDDVAALLDLLAIHLTPGEDVSSVLADGISFRAAVTTLIPGPEGLQLFHRFSDPVFRANDYLYRAIAAAARPRGPVLDFGGGAGHLTGGLVDLVADLVVLADISFPKLWLASRFTAPAATAVCCDGNGVLPFAAGTFSLVTSSDSFHYVWPRQLLAQELRRVRTDDGTLVLAHLHNALVYNPSAGMPLSPAGYRRLLGDRARLLPETDLLRAALQDDPVDLRGRPLDSLKDVPAIAVVDPGPDLGDQLPSAVQAWAGRPLEVNPLYRRDEDGVWRLSPPTPEYQEEYADMLSYLPLELTLSEDVVRRARAGPGSDDSEIEALCRARVLLDLPPDYV